MKLLSKKVFGNPDAKIYDYIIAIGTLSNRSHSELQFSNGRCFSASYTRGVRFRTPIDTSNPKKWSVIELNGIDEKKAEEDCRSYLGMGYDATGAVLSSMNVCKIRLGIRAAKNLFLRFTVVENKLKKFCSEVCTDVLRKQGYDLSDGCKNDPGRLERSVMKIIKRGA